jgi:hypothetical protein
MSRLLLVSEIIRRLQLHRQHWGHITVVASMSDVSCQTIRRIIRSRRMSLRLQIVLSDILERLDRKEIIIKHNTPAIAKGDNVNKLLIEERPADAPQVQRRIVRASEYSRWARCNACGNAYFSAIKRTRSDGENPRYYACDGCVDTPERIMMGGPQLTP